MINARTMRRLLFSFALVSLLYSAPAFAEIAEQISSAGFGEMTLYELDELEELLEPIPNKKKCKKIKGSDPIQCKDNGCTKKLDCDADGDADDETVCRVKDNKCGCFCPESISSDPSLHDF